jgi:hypothetical protein
VKLRSERAENDDFSGPEGEFKNCNYSPDLLDCCSNFIAKRLFSPIFFCAAR